MSTLLILVCVWPGVVLGLGYAVLQRIMKTNDSPAAKLERSLKAQALIDLRRTK
jgi:hypothetical protein